MTDGQRTVSAAAGAGGGRPAKSLGSVQSVGRVGVAAGFAFPCPRLRLGMRSWRCLLHPDAGSNQ